MLVITVTDDLRMRSQPGLADTSVRYAPLLARATRLRILAGPVAASVYWWYRVAFDDPSEHLDNGVRTGWVAASDHDGQPWIGPDAETCLDAPFPSASITARSFAQLEAAMIGTWAGCVTTPWVPPYWVTFTFRADGTYAAASQPDQLGTPSPALYYGTDDDIPGKTWALNDFQASRKGIGQIDVVFWEGNANRGDLRNIALMGDRLQFEFFHQGDYGPLTYRLYRVGNPR